MDVEQLLFEANYGAKKLNPLEVHVKTEHKNDMYEKQMLDDVNDVLRRYKKIIPLYCNTIIIDSKKPTTPFPKITLNSNIWALSKPERDLMIISQLIQLNLHHWIKDNPHYNSAKVLLMDNDKVNKTRDNWESSDQYFRQLIVTFNEFNLLYKKLNSNQFTFIINGFWRPYKLLDKQLGHIWYEVKKILKEQKLIIT